MEKRVKCSNPRCAGKAPSLSINTEKGVYYCFRCGAKGRLDNFKPEKEGWRYDETKLQSLPDGTGPLTSGGHSYIRSRNVSEFTLTSVPILESPTGLVFPFPGEAYWQERRWPEHRPPNWINSTPAPRSPSDGVVYNINTFRSGNRVVVVEGIFDALAVAEFENSAAILGSQIKPAQAEELSRHYTKAFIMLDADAPISKVVTTKNILQGYFDLVKIILLTTGDPSSTDTSLMAQIIFNKVTFQ